MNQFNNNFSFQKQYYSQIEQILKENAFNFIKIRIATDEEDCHKATDFVVEIEGGEIAVRIRRNNCKFRDLTIRTHTKYGNKTEIDKIKEGFSKYYLYGWTNNKNYIEEYIVVDIDKLRFSNLLSKQREISNKDGTKFIAIPLIDLIGYECILTKKLTCKT